jgi:three-Cys-motif partner protein
MAGQQHQFGGTWTEDKLDRLSKYLRAYMTALKNQPFRRAYIDAFAGTGYRAAKQPGETVRGFFPLGPLKELAKGSARRALEVEPAFDRYYFIEANAGRFRELVKLRAEFPALQNRMSFRNDEANSAIASLFQTEDWRSMRAVMFLDPYGMQVEWTTIELIAVARYVDLWYLFPVGIVQRLLQRRGNIIPQWEAALDRVLGDREWRDRFYARSGFFSLFPENDAEMSKVATVDVIERYVRDRLDNLFRGGVAHQTLRLRNSKNSCMFLLFFDCRNPNPKAHQLAMRIAENVLAN